MKAVSILQMVVFIVLGIFSGGCGNSSEPSSLVPFGTVENRSPIAIAQNITIEEDQSIPLTLSGVDVDGDTLSYEVLSSPTNGALSGTAPDLTYIPSADYHGMDSFAFRVSDGEYYSDTAMVSVAVGSVNDAPRITESYEFPTVISSVDTPHYANAVVLSKDNSKAFVADKNGGLQIIDISDSLAPTIIGFIDTPSIKYDVVLSSDDSKAFVASGDLGLQIVDVSDSTSPVLLGSVSTPSSARDVAISSDNSKAYIADYISGLQIIDVTNPTAPTIAGSIATPDNAFGVTLSYDNKTAFVADVSGLQIIDISNSVIPIIISSVVVSVSRDIALSSDGSTLYLTSKYGFKVVDISDLTNPAIIGSIPITYGSVFLNDNNVYVADYSGLEIVDVSNPFFPKTTYIVETAGIAQDVTLSADNSKAYVADGYFGLQIIDLNTPFTQNVITSEDSVKDIMLMANDAEDDGLLYSIIKDPKHGVLSGVAPYFVYTPDKNFVGVDYFSYIANDGQIDSEEAMVHITISSDIIFTLNTPGSAGSVTLSSDKSKAYVADYSEGVQIIDISDFNAMSIIKTIGTSNKSYDVEVSTDNSVVCIAEKSDGLKIHIYNDDGSEKKSINVNNTSPINSSVLSSDNNMLAIANADKGVIILDINSESALSSIDTKDAKSVQFSNDDTKIYVADGAAGLKIIDISDTSSPTIISSIDTPVNAIDIVLSNDDNMVFIADSSGLQIVDVSNPAAPYIVGSIDTLHKTMGITLSSDDSKAYIADGNAGLRIVDVSNPTVPVIVDTIDTGYANDVVLSSDETKAIVADGNRGLHIIDITDTQ